MKDKMRILNVGGTFNNGLFSDYRSQAFIDKRNCTGFNWQIINGVNTEMSFSITNTSRKLHMVTKLIKTQDERKQSRDVFYIVKRGPSMDATTLNVRFECGEFLHCSQIITFENEIYCKLYCNHTNS